MTEYNEFFLTVIEAPPCRDHVLLITPRSSNNFGAKYWTDGYQDFPMGPRPPRLNKSSTEKILFWMEDARVLGHMEFENKSGNHPDPRWRNAKVASAVTVEDYHMALREGIADTEERIHYVWTQLWWRANDRIRYSKAKKLTKKEKGNLESFLAILTEEKPENVLSKAELLRELSRFEESLELLNRSWPEELQRAADRIRELAKQQKHLVARVHYPSPWENIGK